MSDLSFLSKKELRILTALSFGGLNKEIAADLNISVNTVKKHLKNIYRKLHVHTRNEAVEKYVTYNKARRNNILPMEFNQPMQRQANS